MNNDLFFVKANKTMWPAPANVFVIKDDDGLILIEVGCGIKKFSRNLFKKFDDLNLKLTDIHTIVISHAHPDHMGGIEEMSKRINLYDVKFIFNEIEKESAQNIDLLNNSFDVNLIKLHVESGLEDIFQGKIDINHIFKRSVAMSQLPKDINVQIIKDNNILRLGDYTFKVLITPGHALGHTAFYEINHKFLLSGDLIGEFGTAWYSPSSGGAIEYLTSLEKVEKLNIEYIYPSHGDKFYNVKERINEIRNKILIKDKIILENLEQNPLSVLELTKLFFKTKVIQIFPGIAIVESHLIKLEKENKIERKNKMIYKI